MTKTPLPLHQKATLLFYRAYWRKHGFAPSFAEAALHFGITVQAVFDIVRKLLRRGHLEKIPDKRSRNYRLTRKRMP